MQLKTLKDIQKDLNIKVEETIFLGDDINDLTVLPNTALFVVPSDANIGCKRKASYISKSEGGKGFVREIVDNLLISKNLDPYLPFETNNDQYLQLKINTLLVIKNTIYLNFNI